MLFRTSSAMASDSPESMVVWLASPTRVRSRSKSKPGDTAWRNRASSAASLHPRSMKSQIIRASAMSNTTRYRPSGYFITWLAVALVSSW